MLTDWIHWFSSLNPEIKVAVVVGLLVIDFPRYVATFLAMSLWDWCCDVGRWARGKAPERAYGYCPTVCVVLPGYNEADTIEATLTSICGSYPRLEVVVIDDGSEDETSEIVRRFARTHGEVRLLHRPVRGGKASAMNWALHYTNAEVVVCVDADSHLGPNAIWEIVQPLKNPDVGAVSGAVLARNPFFNLVTRLQSQEYLRTIFLGRKLAGRLGFLSIISGAFGAFRHAAIKQVGGWNVGPGEDSDLSQTIRKCGLDIAIASEAQCFTTVPTTWRGLFKQRLRLDRSIVRGKLRQHVDVLNPFGRHFRFTSFWDSLENLFFCVICLYGFWGYAAWQVIRAVFLGDNLGWEVLVACLLCYLCVYPIQLAMVLYYSNDRARDLRICVPLWPLATFYQIFLGATRLVAVTGELLFRKSYQDNFYPARCRQATWRW